MIRTCTLMAKDIHRRRWWSWRADGETALKIGRSVSAIVDCIVVPRGAKGWPVDGYTMSRVG